MVLRWGRTLLGRADASGESRCIRLRRRRDLESWSTVLLRRRVVGRLLNNLLHVLVLLLALIHEVTLNTSHRVVVRVDTWLAHDWSDDRLHVVLNLLLIHVLWSDWWSSKLLLLHAQIHALELLGGCLNVGKLLLETLLLLCEVHVGSYQLSIQVWIHLLLTMLVNQNLGRCENLLWYRVHLIVGVVIDLAIPVSLTKVVGRLGSAIRFLLGIDAASKTGVVLQLGRRSSRREGT